MNNLKDLTNMFLVFAEDEAKQRHVMTMNDWINIHIESGEFCAIEEGIMIFHDFYDTFIQELNKRCIFIVDDKTNEKVGTATVFLLSKEEFGYNSAVDWVAKKKTIKVRV